MPKTFRKVENAKITLAFIKPNKKRVYINQNKIVYLMMMSDYAGSVIPTIALSISVDNELYSDIQTYKSESSFYLKITKKNISGSSVIQKTYLESIFKYIPSTTNPNFEEELSSEYTDNTDNSYKRIMIGLLNMDMLNVMRKGGMNYIYRDIDQSTLLSIALKNFKQFGFNNAIIESLTYNNHYDQIIVPPTDTVYKFVEFIYGKDKFYDTDFRLFLDFDNILYLVSKRGEAVIKNANFQKIRIIIDSIQKENAYKYGVGIGNGEYYLYANPANINVLENRSTDKISNTIISVDEDDGVKYVDLDANKYTGSATKPVYIRSSSPGAYKNEIESDSIVLEIAFEHVNGTIFTINKAININAYNEYEAYNGNYILIYKKEFLNNVSGEFKTTTIVGLQKVGNITPKKAIKNYKKNKISKGTKKSSATKKTKQNTNKVR